jgi:hypothetical protein
VRERIWCTPDKGYERPFARRIGVQHGTLSRRLQRIVTDFGADDSFDNAAAKVEEHYGFKICSSSVRKCILASARKAAKLLEKQYAQYYRDPPEQGAQSVVAQLDGSMIRTLKAGPRKAKRPRLWREVRLCAALVKGKVEALYAATFADVDAVGQRWGHCAKQAGRCLASRIHGLGDGADWIALQFDKIFGESGRFMCDFFHVVEYLGAAAPLCRPGNPEGWRHTQCRRLKRGDQRAVLKELRAHLEPESTPSEEAPVRAAHRYIANRRDQLDYPGALAQELPIGSGLIESGHRHVLQARLKGPGRAWLEENAEAMAQLRVLRPNKGWELLWN